MGYRGVIMNEDLTGCEFRLMEIVMVRKSSAGEISSSQVMIIDNDHETLRHVHENWNDFISNMIKVKKLEENDRKREAEGPDMFSKKLQPIFSRITETRNKNLLANLSKSLKKALILMAIERYEGNKDVVCKVLGINRERLDSEMSLCGLKQERKAA